nr:NADH dehydrogenase subunit 4L [Inocellia (Epinocellia) sp.]
MLMVYMIILYLSGLLIFCLNFKHFLITLLSLEYLVISLFIFMMYFLGKYGYEMYFSMIFITFCVCEGSLGLAILVSLIRTHGNDYFKSFNFLSC